MSFSVVWKYTTDAVHHAPPGVFLLTMEDDRPPGRVRESGWGLALAGAVVAVLCSLPHRDGPSSSTGLKTRGDLAHAGGRMLNLVRFLGFVALLDKVFPNGCGYPPR
jgi:hypothetical protein